MADLTLTSLQAGLNDTDPAISLDREYCTVATNVEFDLSRLGTRRLGCVAITGPGAAGGVQWLYRHLPTTDQTAAELWGLWVTGTTPAMHYKDTTWRTVTFTDALDASSNRGYEVQAATIHGKLFLAYKSSVDRLHVRDAGSLNVRRAGHLTPTAAPTAADTGSGSYTGTRYFRIRYTTQVSSVTVRRSEPSAVLTFAPGGAGASARVTKPATISESETHWELEASLDNASFYRIATTVVGTTTYDDSTVYATGYALTGTLSATSGDYTVPHSPKFLAVDEDRLLLGGSWEQSALSSRVSWTVVYGDTTGLGNDERIPIATTNFVDLDTYEGGELTGLSPVINGYVYAFKRSHIYQLIRTGNRAKAYVPVCLSKTVGALPHSLHSGIDQQGRACLYFVDQSLGPCRLGEGGLQTCSRDVLTTWRTLNPDATVTIRALFYPLKRQLHWWFAHSTAVVPDLRMVLQTDLTRQTEHDGIRRGWAKHDGVIATARAACLFAENVETGAARSYTLRPFIGLSSGAICRCDTGTDDTGTAYAARVVSAPIASANVLNYFGVLAGAVVATAATAVTLVVQAIRDFGLATESGTITLTAAGSEADVVKVLDDLSVAEVRVLQIGFADSATPTGTWNVHRAEFKQSAQGTS